MAHLQATFCKGEAIVIVNGEPASLDDVLNYKDVAWRYSVQDADVRPTSVMASGRVDC